MSEARIQELEMRLSFQENALQTMSDEMAKQQQQIEIMLVQMQRLQKDLESATSGPAMKPQDEPPPPHY